MCRFGGATDTGNRRDHNEDTWQADPETGLWLVADGMGGHEAGEVAADIVSEVVGNGVMQGRSLTEAIHASHQAVLDAGREGRGVWGMGSTIVALQVSGFDYEIAWVGDSRIYLWDGENLGQISHDHSVVQDLLDQGYITREEALVHPEKNLITQALGSIDLQDVVVDTLTGQFLKGQQILLCSDGLNDEVRDEQIADILGQGQSEQDTVDALIKAALANGGSDNVTAILVSAPDDAPEEYVADHVSRFEAGSEAAQSWSRYRPLMVLLAVSAVLLLLVYAVASMVK